MTPTIAEQKATARKAAFGRRKTAHRPGDHGQKLLAEIGAVRGRVIAGYMPIRTEIDPLPTMAVLAQENTLCVPIVRGAGQALEFRTWSPGCALEKGAFGALIPTNGSLVQPDTLIVPLVAFTDGCFRLGYGGGFYDRTLHGLRQRGPIRALGFAYEAQFAPSLPLEDTDQPLDVIVTEDAIHRP